MSFVGEAKRAAKPSDISVEFPTSSSESRRYGNLDYGLRIQVRSDVYDRDLVNTSDLPSKEVADFPRVIFEESPGQSAEQYLYSVASSLGFKTGSDPNTDFILKVTIKDMRLRVRDYNIKKKIFSSSAAMVVEWELLDANMEPVITPRTSTGHGSARSQAQITSPLSQSFAEALSNIDWDAIASKLKVAKTARQEKNKEVGGMGNTALEHTVIRWYIISSPQGADVSWRVVSSTPDVANTNANFVGSTPYESTESFDIR
ncbi:MAG: hypothetical protein K2J58_07240 [Muribaculaceae bacterium]|nr:hypothetical protein [Muribaculaceae bacterium]